MKLVVNGKVLDLLHTQVMGILNVTPDSFFDGGRYNTISKSIDHVSKMICQGATLIDIGGESTRPGSYRISEEEEAERVLPVIHAVLDRFDIFVSVNTSSALVMNESAILGVHLINDIRSLDSYECMQVAVKYKLPVCLMHMQGNPGTMQAFPHYVDILYEVNEYFKKQIMRCELSGIDKTQLLLDPGFGFGKNLVHNYQLLSNLNYFHHFNLPLLVGLSRKSMLSCVDENNIVFSSKQRLMGSVACAVVAAMQGVQIIRVHDVKETVEALRVVRMLRKLNKFRNYSYGSG